MSQIEELTLPKVRNAEHYQFHYDILQLFTDEEALALGIKPLVDAYRASFSVEEERFRAFKGFKETPAIVESDRLRDRIFGLISKVTRSYLSDTNKTYREAAVRVSSIVHQYGNAAVKPFNEESAIITKICSELKKPEMAADLILLNLADKVDELQQANNQSINLVSERHLSQPTAQKEYGVLRSEVDAAYKKLVKTVNAMDVFFSNVTLDAAKAPIVTRLINDINSHIEYLKKIYSIRTLRKETSKGDKNSSGTSSGEDNKG